MYYTFIQVKGGRGFPKRSRASHAGSFLRPSSPVVNPPAIPLLTESVDSKPTTSERIPVEVITINQPQKSVTTRDADDEEIPQDDLHVTRPNTAVSDNGGVSDISTCTESEDDTHTHISCHAEGNMVEVVIEDMLSDRAGSTTISKDDTNGLVDGHPVKKVTKETEVSLSGNNDITRSSRDLSLPLDEEVRVFVPSMPE